jgi:hypothetical protein
MSVSCLYNPIEGFWRTVETNLRTGRFRLLFVADQTTGELRRLVEFLNNEKLTDIEVLIVEVKRYTQGSPGPPWSPGSSG